MRIEIITLFPQIFPGFLTESLLARAQKKRLLTIKTHDLRKWTNDKHKTVDDRPYGGGAGMVLKIEPIFRAVKELTLRRASLAQGGRQKTRIILLSAKGRTFTQKDARRLSKYEQLVFICGRYEGIDERVAKYVADEEISIGNYVLFGGEVASMVIIEAVSRLIFRVVQKEESIKNESFSDKEAIVKEYPQYTRPEVFIPKRQATRFAKASARQASDKRQVNVWKVPKVLLSGNHKKIAAWQSQASLAPKEREEWRSKNNSK